MPKVTPHRQDATDYIRLSELPAPQAQRLRDWLPESYLTKLEQQHGVADDCIEYEDYEFWYDHSRPSEDTRLNEQL
ncbi:hypothetical protein [Cesiribacter andamanensis]|uniref:Uncharacterized protein n=1 Tax=Cesiribacter andamanensis AMV16 TaxID=1279009 RepID=M7N8U8_9BACT|nr:hypothetical protein [Cesiribacter andamanensis]EMR03636.1 hypothetical protein ADICEAN_01233 [Cesiribacter andamanensis AMV16]